MNKEHINNEIMIFIPDGFEKYESEELKRLNQEENSKLWSIKSTDNEFKIILSWKNYNSLLLKLADLKVSARRNERIAKKAYTEKGLNYKLDSFFSKTVDGRKAEGYRFTFTRDGVDKAIDNILFKGKKCIYALTCMGPLNKFNQLEDLFDKEFNLMTFQ